MLRNLLMISLLLTLGIFGLSACGNNNQTAAPAQAPQEAAPAAEATTTEAPVAAAVPATETPTTAAVAEVVETVTPAGGDAAEATGATGAEEAALEATTQPEEAVTNIKLNLNEAAPEEFQATIPNFGERMTHEFLEYRPYISIQQFRREIGKYVDEAQVTEYEQYVYVPVNVNEADAETLQQIPGVDETVAAELVAARPYESNETFLAKLAETAPGADLAAAASYLVSQ